MTKALRGAAPSGQFDAIRVKDLGQGAYPSGRLVIPANIMSATAGTHASGMVYFAPLDVTQPISIDALYAYVSTAQSGGTSPSFTLGIYGSKANGMPETANLLASGTIGCTSTGNKNAAFTAITLPPGRYWLAALYYVPSAPTTAPKLNAIANNTGYPPFPTSGNVGTTYRGLTLASQTALPTTTTADSSFGVSGSSAVPVIAVHIA